MTSWNRSFSDLIRKTRSAYWGNWSLNPQIKVGAVGIVDPHVGDFRLVADAVPGARVIDRAESSSWTLASEHVSRKETNGKLDVAGIDPETGTKIDVGLTVGWGLGEAGAIVSEFALSHESVLDDFGTLAQQQMSFLVDKAKSVGMATATGIAQGFGIITGVLWAKSGVNVGAQEADSSFAIGGSVKAINALLGKAGGAGSYVSSSQKRSVDRHVWPDQSNLIAPTEMPIAYTFASFDNRLLIPNWVNNIGAFELVLCNEKGCTYITEAKLTYKSPSGDHEEKVKVSGGLTKTIGNIPLEATDLKLKVTFKGVANDDDYKFHWDRPLGQWLTGQRHIDMSGVWPGKTHCKDREG